MNPYRIKFIFLYWLIAGLIPFNILAQKIMGTIGIPDGSPAEFATVVLQQANDELLVKGAISDEKGNFEIAITNPGRYILVVKYLGYENYVSEILDYSGSELTIPLIQLKTNSTELATVQIVARRPLIEIKPDRTVFNVSAAITTAGTNGLELLRKAPNISIDNDDNIALRGKNGVVLYFDGKRSYLSAAELASLLRGLNAADIESIEIITNPSSRYDAAGNAGIVNIITKKGKLMGTNGSISISSAYQKRPKNNASFSLNHRTQNFNVYGGASVGKNTLLSTLEAVKEQDERVFHQFFENTITNTPLNSRLGVDFSSNPQHAFGFLMNVNSNLGNRTNELYSETFISDGLTLPTDSILIASSHSPGSLLNASANFNYQFTDSIGNTLNFDIDRGIFRTDAINIQPNRYVNADRSITLVQRDYRTESKAAIDIFTAKADFEHKFAKTGTSFAAGAKFAQVISDNSFDFFNTVGQQNQLDETQSNQFTYTEQVSAAYISGIIPFQHKWMLQSGLRWENTHSIGSLKRLEGQQQQPNDYLERHYNNIFPSSSLTLNLSESQSWNLSYSRRIDRPVYENLNPFEWRIDEISFRKGSPFLRPEFSNNVELKYTFNRNRIISAGYSISKDNIVNIIEIDRDEPDKIFVNFRNLATRKYYAINMGSPINYKNWWTGFMNVTFHINTFVADFPEFKYKLVSPLSINLFAQQTFSLGHGLTYEVSGWYNSSTISNNGFRVVPMGSLDMGFQKKILRDRGTLKLSYTDLLRTANWEGRNNAVSGLSVHTTTVRETQLIQLNFSYRFGNTSIKSEKSRNSGSEAERKRIGQ